MTHLTKQGYNNEEDIEEIYIVNMGEDEVIYVSVVTFTDEPKETYFYTYKHDTNEIMQLNSVDQGIDEQLKHKEN